MQEEEKGLGCCRANVAPTLQSRPDSGLGFEVKVLTTFQVVPFSLGSGIAPNSGGIQQLQRTNQGARNKGRNF